MYSLGFLLGGRFFAFFVQSRFLPVCKGVSWLSPLFYVSILAKFTYKKNYLCQIPEALFFIINQKHNCLFIFLITVQKLKPNSLKIVDNYDN